MYAVTAPAALGEFAQCRDVLRRALRIEDSPQLRGAFAAATVASSGGGGGGGVVELLALCARAAAACGDADDAMSMIKKASAMAAALRDGLPSRSVFWFHVTCGEAHMIVAESSHLSAAAAAAAASFSLGLKSIPSASTVARMKLRVATGKISRSHHFFRVRNVCIDYVFLLG